MIGTDKIIRELECLRCGHTLEEVAPKDGYWLPHAYDVHLYRCPRCGKLELYERIIV